MQTVSKAPPETNFDKMAEPDDFKMETESDTSSDDDSSSGSNESQGSKSPIESPSEVEGTPVQKISYLCTIYMMHCVLEEADWLNHMLCPSRIRVNAIHAVMVCLIFSACHCSLTQYGLTVMVMYKYT